MSQCMRCENESRRGEKEKTEERERENKGVGSALDYAANKRTSGNTAL